MSPYSTRCDATLLNFMYTGILVFDGNEDNGLVKGGLKTTDSHMLQGSCDRARDTNHNR